MNGRSTPGRLCAFGGMRSRGSRREVRDLYLSLSLSWGCVCGGSLHIWKGNKQVVMSSKNDELRPTTGEHRAKLERAEVLAAKAGWWAGCVAAMKKYSYTPQEDVETVCQRMLEEEIITVGMEELRSRNSHVGTAGERYGK